jgi:hypothetical protein
VELVLQKCLLYWDQLRFMSWKFPKIYPCPISNSIRVICIFVRFNELEFIQDNPALGNQFFSIPINVIIPLTIQLTIISCLLRI